jgi:hypothetical protein
MFDHPLGFSSEDMKKVIEDLIKGRLNNFSLKKYYNKKTQKDEKEVVIYEST